MMLERDIAQAISDDPSLIEDGLILVGRERPIGGVRPDFLFLDRHGCPVIVELKRGTAPRSAVGQLIEYLGHVSLTHPDVRGVLVAERVPEAIRRGLEHHGLEWCEVQVTTPRAETSPFGALPPRGALPPHAPPARAPEVGTAAGRGVRVHFAADGRMSAHLPARDEPTFDATNDASEDERLTRLSVRAWSMLLAPQNSVPPVGALLASHPNARALTADLVSGLTAYRLVAVADAMHNKCGPKELRKRGVNPAGEAAAAEAWSQLLAGVGKRYDPARGSGWLEVIRILTPREVAGIKAVRELPIDRLARVAARVVADVYYGMVKSARLRG